MLAGFIKVTDNGNTNIPGIYAAGDNCTPMRTLSAAMNAGVRAAAFVNHELISEAF
jgi:thioredoxin reductase